MSSLPPSDEAQIVRAAKEMMAAYGDEALSKIDTWTKGYRAEGFNSIAQRWELIREVIKDLQAKDDKMHGYNNALMKGVSLSE